MLGRLRRVSSRLAYQNRWMRVREDVIERADGTQGIYGVVEKTDFAVIAAFEDNCLHLVEQYRYPADGHYWEMPQGAIEAKPDADPIEIAKTELREETGLLAATWVAAGSLFQGYGFSVQQSHVFLATGLTRTTTALEDTEQDLISRAFPLDEVESMIRNGIIKDASTVAAFGLLRLGGHLRPSAD
jgi:ADP-ribose pyrophosphatase